MRRAAAGMPTRSSSSSARRAGRLLAHALVLDQHLGHLARDPQVGIERGHRVLEDHRQADAADSVQLARRQVQELLAAKARAAGADAVAGEQAHDREEGLGLARAGLADHPHALAGLDGAADLADRSHLALGRGEAGGQIGDFQDRGHRRQIRSLPSARPVSRLRVPALVENALGRAGAGRAERSVASRRRAPRSAPGLPPTGRPPPRPARGVTREEPATRVAGPDVRE